MKFLDNAFGYTILYILGVIAWFLSANYLWERLQPDSVGRFFLFLILLSVATGIIMLIVGMIISVSNRK